MGEFLLLSIVASVVLTVVLNVLVRFWKPDPRRWFRPEVDRRPAVPPPTDADRGGGSDGFGRPRVRVFFPWKAMLVISIVLTVVVNVVALLSR